MPANTELTRSAFSFSLWRRFTLLMIKDLRSFVFSAVSLSSSSSSWEKRRLWCLLSELHLPCGVAGFVLACCEMPTSYVLVSSNDSAPCLGCAAFRFLKQSKMENLVGLTTASEPGFSSACSLEFFCSSFSLLSMTSFIFSFNLPESIATDSDSI